MDKSLASTLFTALAFAFALGGPLILSRAEPVLAAELRDGSLLVVADALAAVGLGPGGLPAVVGYDKVQHVLGGGTFDERADALRPRLAQGG